MVLMKGTTKLAWMLERNKTKRRYLEKAFLYRLSEVMLT